MNVAGACCMCINRSVVCHAVFLGLRALSIRPCFFLFLWFSVHVSACEHGVAKIASHAIFQYIVLIINDAHNTWTNIIVKMIILRFLGSSDDKEKIGKVRPEGPPLRKNRRHGILVQKGIKAKSAYRHQMNRWFKKRHRCIGRTVFQRRCKSRKS